MSRGVRSTAFIAGVFVFGLIAGVGLGRWHILRGLQREMSGSTADVRMRFRLEAMTRRLNLSDDQRKHIEEVMRAAEPERDHALENCTPALRDLRVKVDNQIREQLTPEQRVRFETLLDEKHGPGSRP